MSIRRLCRDLPGRVGHGHATWRGVRSQANPGLPGQPGGLPRAERAITRERGQKTIPFATSCRTFLAIRLSVGWRLRFGTCAQRASRRPSRCERIGGNGDLWPFVIAATASFTHALSAMATVRSPTRSANARTGTKPCPSPLPAGRTEPGADLDKAGHYDEHVNCEKHLSRLSKK